MDAIEPTVEAPPQTTPCPACDRPMSRPVFSFGHVAFACHQLQCFGPLVMSSQTAGELSRLLGVTVRTRSWDPPADPLAKRLLMPDYGEAFAAAERFHAASEEAWAKCLAEMQLAEERMRLRFAKAYWGDE